MSNPLYDVFIYEIATRKIDAVIGRNMPSYEDTGVERHSVELRIQTAQERINDAYNVNMYPAGKYNKGDILPE